MLLYKRKNILYQMLNVSKRDDDDVASADDNGGEEWYHVV